MRIAACWSVLIADACSSARCLTCGLTFMVLLLSLFSS
jgi:hypothetical protein